MNILLTSVGRRGYLVEYFKQIDGCRVYVANSHKTHVFALADEGVESPLIYSNEYIDFLLDYCIKNKIDVVISLFDVDLMVLAKNKHKFEEKNIRVIVSDERIIDVCNDKWNTYKFLKENGFKTPKTYLHTEDVIKEIGVGNLNYPVIIKPRWGMGSIGVYIAENQEELNVFYNKVKRTIEETYLIYESRENFDKCVVIQEMLKGEEYGMDVINDLDGNYQSTVIRRKLAMRNGETDIAEIVENKEIHDASVKLSSALGHIGNLDSDAFLVDGEVYILEMNARFGGGYPFGHIAGVNLPLAIVKWLRGEKAEENLLKATVGVKAYKNIQLVVE